MASCATLDFFSVAPHANFSYFDAEPEDAPQPAVYSDIVLPSTEEAAIDAELALADETDEEVEALLAFAFASPSETYDMVSATIAGFRSKSAARTAYAAMFNAAARVALERSHPQLLAEWLAGSDAEEIKALVGAELAKLRPSQLVWKPTRRAPRARKVKRVGWN